MRNKIIFALVILGVVGAIASSLFYARRSKPLPPVFNPAPNPYSNGIYANGIVESFQASGANTNIYPEIPGLVVRIYVHEGETVVRGTPLLEIESSVQKATVEQQKSQAEAAQALLEELRAQPRRETLDVARAQVVVGKANLKTAVDELDKQQRSYTLAPESVSKDVLDNAVNAEKVATANVEMVTRQYDLTRAGAWSFDIRNQQKLTEALVRAYASGSALLAKYTVRAPVDGVIMQITSAAGSYVSPQGTYDTYTQGFDPIFVMGNSKGALGVRCYIDEILIPRLPPPEKMEAQMFIRGTDTKIPLTFVRIQPYVSPKIELSNQRQEKVDLRVLPVIFRFDPPAGMQIFPGQMVDVYVAGV